MDLLEVEMIESDVKDSIESVKKKNRRRRKSPKAKLLETSICVDIRELETSEALLTVSMPTKSESRDTPVDVVNLIKARNPTVSSSAPSIAEIREIQKGSKEKSVKGRKGGKNTVPVGNNDSGKEPLAVPKEKMREGGLLRIPPAPVMTASLDSKAQAPPPARLPRPGVDIPPVRRSQALVFPDAEMAKEPLQVSVYEKEMMILRALEAAAQRSIELLRRDKSQLQSFLFAAATYGLTDTHRAVFDLENTCLSLLEIDLWCALRDKVVHRMIALRQRLLECTLKAVPSNSSALFGLEPAQVFRSP